MQRLLKVRPVTSFCTWLVFERLQWATNQHQPWIARVPPKIPETTFKQAKIWLIRGTLHKPAVSVVCTISLIWQLKLKATDAVKVDRCLPDLVYAWIGKTTTVLPVSAVSQQLLVHGTRTLLYAIPSTHAKVNKKRVAMTASEWISKLHNRVHRPSYFWRRAPQLNEIHDLVHLHELHSLN